MSANIIIVVCCIKYCIFSFITNTEIINVLRIQVALSFLTYVIAIRLILSEYLAYPFRILSLKSCIYMMNEK